MQSFKGLISRNLLTDDSFIPLNRKVEEHRKVTQISIDFFQCIQRIYGSQYVQYEKSLDSLNVQDDYMPEYYNELIDVFEQISSQTRRFNEKISGSFKEMTTVCGVFFSDYSNAILNFQQQVRSYQNHQQMLFQMSKKYFRSLKLVQASIEAYKASFSDVKLIYNVEERIKRYNTCKADYDTVCKDLTHIQQKVDKVNEMKDSITKAYQTLGEDLGKMLQSIGTRQISEAKSFTNHYCFMQKSIVTMFAEKKSLLDKLKLNCIVGRKDLAVDPQHFNCQIKPSKAGQPPALLQYHQHLKQEFAPLYIRALMDYPKLLALKMNQRKTINKKVFQFIQGVIRIIQKSHMPNLKEAIGFFEKNKKRIGQSFSNKFVSFLKSIFSLLQISQGINEKLLKDILPKVTNIQQLLAQDSKTFDLIQKQLQNTLEKMVGGKKQFKKIKGVQGDLIAEEQNSKDNIKLKKDISDKAVFLQHFIGIMNSKFIDNYDKIKFNYNGIVNDILLSENELYSLSCEYQVMYFGAQQFQANLQKYEADLKNVVVKEQQFFKQINFGVLLSEQSKIVFNGETQKYEEFKKLKKPIQNKLPTDLPKPVLEARMSSASDGRLSQELSTGVDISLVRSESQGVINQSELRHQTSNVDGNADKYLQFLMSKVQLGKDEELVKTFACALSDKIILQGRLYITTNRICFHSKFNPSTVFFGGTFIQVPREDIKKLEKRYNAIFFDNSISITTINGQIFLTSFFSRDEAFQLLCRTLDINNDHALEEQNEKSIIMEDEKVGPMQDDITQQQLQQRVSQIDKMLKKEFQFKEIISADLEYEGLNALKVLKIFYSGQEVMISRKNYPSFMHYFKQQIMEVKDLEINPYEPNLFEYLNPDNVKRNTPLCFKRNMKATIPLKNTGVPFMPKFSNGVQDLSLFIYSKDKWVLDDRIKTSGAPYTDTFQVHVRAVVQTKNENTCSLTYSMYLQFFSKPMIAAIIESRTFSDTTQFQKMTIDEMKKYFKNLDKLKNKNKGKSEQSKQTADDAVNQELQNQLNQSKKQNKALKQQVTSTKQKLLFQRKILLASAVLNIILFILWLS